MKSTKQSNCLPEEVLCGFADGTLREGRNRIEAHISECDRCLSFVSDVLLSARSLAGADLVSPPLQLERQVQGIPTGEEKPGWVGMFVRRTLDTVFSYRTAGALATASLVALAVIWVGQQGPPRGGTPSAIRQPGVVVEEPVLLEPRGEIWPEDGVHFVWKPCPGAEQYVILILAADTGKVVAREAVKSPEHVIPIERLLESGGSHFEWMVECTLDNARVVFSPAVAFTIAEPLVGE